MLSTQSYSRGTKQAYESLFSKYSPANDNQLRCYGKYAHEEFDEFLEEFGISEQYVSGKKILDVGCGVGRLCRELSKRNAHTIGLDIHDHLERYAEEDTSSCMYLRGSAQNIPFANATFDITWCQGVIAYLPNPVRAIKELQRVTKGGGFMYLYIYSYPKRDIAFSIARKVRAYPLWAQNALLTPLSWYVSLRDLLIELACRKPISSKQRLMNLKDWMSPSRIQYLTPDNIIKLFPFHQWNIKSIQSNHYSTFIIQKRTTELSQDNITPSYILSGKSEIKNTPILKSSHNPFKDYSFNILHHFERLNTPCFDKDQEIPSGLNGDRFALCLTHDIDSLEPKNIKTRCRKLSNLYKIYRSGHQSEVLTHIKQNIKSNIRGISSSKFDTLEDLIDLESKLNVRSTLFVFPETTINRHISDCTYKYSDSICFKGKNINFGDFIGTIHQEGWEIGLHASWNAATNLEELIFQKKQIEKLIGASPKSIRQHHLHFLPGITESIQLKAGFEFDSSIGFNHTVGFRRGTCHPWKLLSDPHSGQTLIEVPLIIQDNALFHPYYTSFSFENALQKAKDIINECKKVSGCATILWHVLNPHFTNSLVSLEKLLLFYKDQPACLIGSIEQTLKHFLPQYSS